MTESLSNMDPRDASASKKRKPKRRNSFTGGLTGVVSSLGCTVVRSSCPFIFPGKLPPIFVSVKHFKANCLTLKGKKILQGGFLSAPPDFQHQKNKQAAANQRYFFVKLSV